MRSSVRTKLFLTFAIILILPSLLIGAISYQSAKSDLEILLLQSARDNVALLNQAITRFIEPEKKDVEYLAHINTQSKWQDEATFLQDIERYRSLHPEVINAYVGTGTGKMLLMPKQDLPADYDPRNRPWYEDAMSQKGKVIITAPYLDAVSGNMDITIAKALDDNSGVVAIDLNLATVNDIVLKTKIGQEGYSFILDAAQTFIAHPKIKPGESATSYPFAKQMTDKDFDEFEYTSSGDDYYLAYATNSATGWKVAGTLSKDEVVTLAQPIFTKTLLVIAGAVLLCWVLVSIMVRRLTNPLKALNHASEKIAAGDLTEQVKVTSRDELGQLSAGFNRMVESLRSVVERVADTSSHLAASSSQLSASADQSRQASEHTAIVMQELALGTDKQVQSIEATVQHVTEMSAGIEEISATAQDVTQTATQAAQIAEGGSLSIQKAVAQMEAISATVNHSAATIKDLGEHAQHIGKIVETITGISEQTNLLAINAAIEAARAGEHGKGFAVVADEVRKLAEQSSNSANQITDYIATIQAGISGAVSSMQTGTQEVSVGLDVVNEAGNSFASIRSAVEEVATRIEEVSLAVQEMTVGSEQVAATMETISEVATSTAEGTQNVSAATQQQLASIEEITNSSTALSELAEELERILHGFKL
ncbi:MAG TPA: methyl-accepting chemotaxis protein [Bacilli bacterium]|nr:methyl-accepting chemotaxis protein [Bacilli bacterium]